MVEVTGSSPVSCTIFQTKGLREIERVKESVNLPQARIELSALKFVTAGQKQTHTLFSQSKGLASQEELLLLSRSGSHGIAIFANYNRKNFANKRFRKPKLPLDDIVGARRR